jgi:hypothetical protein
MPKAVTINIRATDGFSHVIEPVKRKMRELVHQMEKFNTRQAAFASGMRNAGRASLEFANRMKWVSIGVLGAGFAALKAAGDYEELAIRYQILTGDMAKGKALLDSLKDFALDAGPFSSDEITDAGKSLLVYKVNAQRVLPVLKMLATNAAGADIPLASLIDSYGRMSRTGFGNARALMSLRKLGIQSMLAERLNMPVNEVSKNIKNIPFHVIEEVLFDIANSYGDILARMDATTIDMIGDTKTLAINATREIGQAMESNIPINATMKEFNAGFKAAIPKIKEFVKTNPDVVRFGLALAGMAIVLPVLAAAFAAIAYAVGLVASVATGWWALVAVAGIIHFYWKEIAGFFTGIANAAKTLGGAFGFGIPETPSSSLQSTQVQNLANEGYSKLGVSSGTLDITLGQGLVGRFQTGKQGELLNYRFNTGPNMRAR